MGKKQKQQKGKTVSLNEYLSASSNPATLYEDPKLAQLPTAPRERDDNEEGDTFRRPPFHPFDGPKRDDDAPEPSWERIGPIGHSGGGGGFNRDGPMRDGGEPDWGRRGPIQSEQGFQGGFSADVERSDEDWRSRRGPLEQIRPPSRDGGMERTLDWGDRRGPIAADPQYSGQAAEEKNWDSVRRGNVMEARPPADRGINWEEARRGPLPPLEQGNGRGDGRGDFERERAGEDIDFVRRGRLPPLPEKDSHPPQVEDREFVRRGPLEPIAPAEPSRAPPPEPDFSRRRGPLEARPPLDRNKENSRERGDIEWTRRGPPPQPAAANPPASTKDNTTSTTGTTTTTNTTTNTGNQRTTRPATEEKKPQRDIEWVRGMAPPKREEHPKKEGNKNWRGERKDQGGRKGDSGPRSTTSTASSADEGNHDLAQIEKAERVEVLENKLSEVTIMADVKEPVAVEGISESVGTGEEEEGGEWEVVRKAGRG